MVHSTTELSLPIGPHLPLGEAEYVVSTIREFVSQT